ISEPSFCVIISMQNFLPLSFRQFGKRLSGGVRNCAPAPYMGLKCLSWIDEDTDLCFQGLAERFEGQAVGSCDPVISFLGRGIDSNLSPLGRKCFGGNSRLAL